MALTSIDKVRQLGNLPAVAKLSDDLIRPHLDSASRELKTWVSDYATAKGDALAAYIEAEGCITIAYLLPVLNTFFTNGITTFQKEVAESEIFFHSPDDLDIIIEKWMDRARSRIDNYLEDNAVSDDESVVASGLSWYVI